MSHIVNGSAEKCSKDQARDLQHRASPTKALSACSYANYSLVWLLGYPRERSLSEPAAVWQAEFEENWLKKSKCKLACTQFGPLHSAVRRHSVDDSSMEST